MASHLDITQQQFAVWLHIRGFPNKLITEQFDCHRNTVSTVINKWRRGEFVTYKQKRVRRAKLSAQQAYNVFQYFISHPFRSRKDCIRDLKLRVSEMTITNCLNGKGLKSYTASSKQFLSLRNQLNRLRFALKYRNWTEEDWARVWFLDEKTVQTYANGRILVRRKSAERFTPSKLVTPEVQNTRNKLNLVGFVSINGPNKVYSVSTCLNGLEFKSLMESKVKPLIMRQTPRPTILMDNSKVHLLGIEFLKQAGVTVLEDYPPKSPDLNPIEHIWGYLQKDLNRRLRTICVSTKPQLQKIVNECWLAIPNEYVRKCINSMPARIEEVIRMQGKQTRY